MGKLNEIKIDMVAGVEGASLYLNDFRICGPKPWGGGKVTKTWYTEIDIVEMALGKRNELDKLT